MTNLLASIVVAVVTNTTEVMPTIMVPASCPDHKAGSNFGCLVAHFEEKPDPNPTEKTIKTVCKEVTTLRFEWDGAREIVKERVLWESNVVMRLSWIATTNTPQPTALMRMINGGGITYLDLSQ